MLESGPFFEVSDGEFDSGVLTVKGIDVDGVAFEIGDEGEVAPLRPQGGLATNEAGASHDEPASLEMHSATSASPSQVYSIGVQADSSMAETALVTEVIIRTPMV